MWSFFTPKPTSVPEPESKESSKLGVDDFFEVEKEAEPSVVFLNGGQSIQTTSEDYEDYSTSSPEVDETHFTVIANLHTANSQPLKEIEYDDKNPLGTSSHDVFKGKKIQTEDVYFVKYVMREMAYVEAFMGQLTEFSLLYGVGRAYARYDATPDPKMTSKGLRHFKTFKDGRLTEEMFSNPEFCNRFRRILAVMFRMMEDDFHKGNLTMPDQKNNSPGLQVFDSDCSYWPATYKVKGPRPNVDNMLPPLGRNPDEAFYFTEEDILKFPNFVYFNPWYFPSRQNPLSIKFSTNPWLPEDVVVVQKLNDEETLHTCFEEFIDWMLDLTNRFPHIAALNIPADMKVPGTEENMIKLYCDVNTRAYNEYWRILPKVPGFAEFVEGQKESILKHILIRTQLRNMRLMQEKEEAKSHPEKEKFLEQFDKAVLTTSDVVKEFNLLIRQINMSSIVSCESMMTTLRVEKRDIAEIDHETVKILIKEAEIIAEEMFNKEALIGKEDWREFEEFDYQYKPKAPAPRLGLG